MNDGGVITARGFAQQLDGLIERKRYTHARALLAEALGQYPDDSDLSYASALLDFLSDDHQESRTTLQRVLMRDPDHFAARSLLAVVCQGLDDLEQSEAVLLDLLKDYPEAAQLYARYAMLMYRTMHVDKAKQLAREALRLDPQDELALTACMIGDMIDGRGGDEKETLAALMVRHPESVSTAHMLIRHLISRGRYGAARRIAIELLKLEPSSQQALSLVIELDALSHWSMLPLWPLNRWGWAASAGLWVMTLLLLNLAPKIVPGSSASVSFALLGYCAYSWIYPPLLKRWLKRRAGI